jgi:hypothetical protein
MTEKEAPYIEPGAWDELYRLLDEAGIRWPCDEFVAYLRDFGSISDALLALSMDGPVLVRPIYARDYLHYLGCPVRMRVHEVGISIDRASDAFTPEEAAGVVAWVRERLAR